MKPLIKILINLLKLLLEMCVDRTGVLKYATSENPWMSGEKGRIDKLIWYSRKGELVTRRKQQSFNIKDPTFWEGRFNRFKAFVHLGKSLKFGLAELYETEVPKLTFMNILISQLNKFWVGGPAPAPYVFEPGTVDVEIGNGSMPDARDVVFAAQAGGNLKITWDTSLIYPNEHDDDLLQIMLIIKTGAFGVWLPMIAAIPGPYVKRVDGTCTWAVPKIFLNPSVTLQCYCSVKFKAGAELAGKVKGIFKFPVGTTPITLIP